MLTNHSDAKGGSHKLPRLSAAAASEGPEYLQRQQHCRQLPASRCLSGCILCSRRRQRRVGHGLFVDSGGQVKPAAAQEQHVKSEGGTMLIIYTQSSTKRNKSFHGERAHREENVNGRSDKKDIRLIFVGLRRGKFTVSCKDKLRYISTQGMPTCKRGKLSIFHLLFRAIIDNNYVQ